MAEYESLTELNFFAVQLRYDNELEVESPDWLAWGLNSPPPGMIKA